MIVRARVQSQCPHKQHGILPVASLFFLGVLARNMGPALLGVSPIQLNIRMCLLFFGLCCSAPYPTSLRRGDTAWPEETTGGFRVLSKRAIQFPLRFLARANASTTHEALECVDASLSLGGVFEMASRAEWVILNVGSDLAASCGRLLQELARQVNDHNKIAAERGMGVIILLFSPCIAHMVHREVTACFQLKQLMPQLYTIHFVSALAGSAAHIKSALEKIVRQDALLCNFVGSFLNGKCVFISVAAVLLEGFCFPVYSLFCVSACTCHML